jgi:metal-dependent amidase/aminoacylase/carboxypeptidase family protein
VRTFEPRVRDRVLAAIQRIAVAEAAAGGATQDPEVVVVESFPAVVNSPTSTDRIRRAFATTFGAEMLLDPGLVTGSEDVGLLASAAGAECVYWLLGGADPSLFALARNAENLVSIVGGLPSNHSPLFAPVVEPTLITGVTALAAGALAWLSPPTG